VRAGSAEGGIDAVNILRPALARGAEIIERERPQQLGVRNIFD
jgi:hypothetical protein